MQVEGRVMAIKASVPETAAGVANWIRMYRVFFALLILAAVGYQLWQLHDNGTLRAGNFFSFFTIQSNLIAAVVLLIGASGARFVVRPTLAWDLVRGGAAIYMTLTFVIYGLLLSGHDVQTTSTWVNDVVHRIAPLLMVYDFLAVPLTNRVTFRKALVWAIYPLAYLAYSLIRGPIVDWYPYPFLDPDQSGGWAGVAGICVAIFIGFMIATWLMTEVGQRMRLRMEARAADPAA